MKSITRLWLICSFLCSAFLSDAQESLRTPDSLFAAGQYRMASIEYERAWLEAGNDLLRAKALMGKAEALKQLAQYEDAERTLNRVKHDELGDSLSYRIRYQLALCSYLQGKFVQTEDILEQMYFAIPDSLLTAPSLMLYALSLNEQRRWDEAKAKMKRMIACSQLDAAMSDSLMHIVNGMYDPVNYPKLKNVRAAKVLSLIIPGSGQIYAGSIGQGIASIVLQAAAVTFTVYSFSAGTYVTSAAAGFSTFARFYGGGSRNAEKIAMKKNYERSRKFNDKLREKVIFVSQACSERKL